MSVINIRSCDLPDGDPIKEMMAQMGRSEETNLINSVKSALTEGRVTKEQVRDRLYEFMGLWKGTRQFYLIPDFVRSLN